MDNIFVVYKKSSGSLNGFYTDLAFVQGLCSKDTNLDYIQISNEIHEWIFDSDYENVKVDVSKVDSIDKSLVVNNHDAFLISDESKQESIDIDAIKLNLMRSLESECHKYIKHGVEVFHDDGTSKLFSYSIQDQIDIQEMLSMKKDKYLYHAVGERLTYYSYEEIKSIYTKLYNNKMFNKIYCQVYCQWIEDNYTVDMFNTPEFSVYYGYSNEDILQQVERIYEDEKLPE